VDKRIFQTAVSNSVPFDNQLTSIRSDNVQQVFEELRSQVVTDPEYTTTSTSGTLTLDSTSKTMQIITGTAIGYKIRLPDATTLFNGAKYEIVNKSTALVIIEDHLGNLRSEAIADSVASLILQNNSTSAGIWIETVVSGFATGIVSYNNNSDVPFSTTSASPVLITGFSVLPIAGKFAVWANLNATQTQNNATAFFEIYRGGILIGDTTRQFTTVTGSGSTQTVPLQTIVQVNGLQEIDVRIYRNSGTLTIDRRSLLLIRLGP